MEDRSYSFTTPCGESVAIRPATAEDIDEMLALEARSINPATFKEITREEIEESIALDLALVAATADKIIALNLLLANRESERSLAYDIGRDPCEVVTFDGVIVAPEYRGLGLQRRFLSIAEDYASSLGAALVAATVAPANLPSRRNFERAGFCELGEFPKYGSTRIIVTKKID